LATIKLIRGITADGQRSATYFIGIPNESINVLQTIFGEQIKANSSFSGTNETPGFDSTTKRLEDYHKQTSAFGRRLLCIRTKSGKALE